MLKGSDFILNADVIFKSDDYEFQDSDVTATCMGAKEKYLYSDEGVKTVTQCGWTYKVYVPARELLINVSVEDNKCAIDNRSSGLKQVKFTNFRATFYVNRKGFLDLSCKADKAELVS